MAAPAPADDVDFPIPDEDSCVSSSCHAETATKKFVHEVAADGSLCIACHQVTEPGRHAIALVVAEEELCTECHDGLADGQYKHYPTEEGQCLFCHDPHQSDFPKQLTSSRETLCLECHEGPEASAAPIHGPVADGQCADCHDPHSSDHSGLLTAGVPALCHECHDKALEDAKGRMLQSVEVASESEESNGHPPFVAGDCLACHAPHASGNYRLLVGSHPESIYASFAVDRYVCFLCHDETAFTEPRTMTETAFRNGNLNLHHRHVNRRKGRTCRTCHQQHSSSREALIRDRPPPGDRFINVEAFERTATGGSCTPTCHRLMLYDRYDPVPHTLKVTPTEGTQLTADELERARNEQATRGND